MLLVHRLVIFTAAEKKGKNEGKWRRRRRDFNREKQIDGFNPATFEYVNSLTARRLQNESGEKLNTCGGKKINKALN